MKSECCEDSLQRYVGNNFPVPSHGQVETDSDTSGPWRVVAFPGSQEKAHQELQTASDGQCEQIVQVAEALFGGIPSEEPGSPGQQHLGDAADAHHQEPKAHPQGGSICWDLPGEPFVKQAAGTSAGAGAGKPIPSVLSQLLNCHEGLEICTSGAWGQAEPPTEVCGELPPSKWWNRSHFEENVAICVAIDRSKEEAQTLPRSVASSSNSGLPVLGAQPLAGPAPSLTT